MGRLLLMLGYLIGSTLYQFFPNYEAANICDYKNPENGWGFLFSDMVLSPQNWVYAFFQHVGEIILSGVILYSWNAYRVALWTFFLLHVVDTLDYCLTYSNPWFNGPPSFNHIKVLLFGLSIIFEKYGR